MKFVEVVGTQRGLTWVLVKAGLKILVTDVPETTHCEATILSIRCIAMALAAKEKEAYCARRDAIWYPWNIPVITSTVMARATQTSINVNAAEPFSRGIGWLSCIFG